MTPEACRALARADPDLAPLVRRVGPIVVAPKRRRSPYRSLVRAVAHQQLTGRAAATILGRVKALYPGRPHPRPEDLLATPDDALRAAGLSRAKVAAVKAIAAAVLDGTLPPARGLDRLADEEVIARLTSIRGVGRWTVEMLLIFELGRPDVLPVHDYGVRKGFARALGLTELPRPRDLAARGEAWRPHRTTAALYLWRAADLPVA